MREEDQHVTRTDFGALMTRVEALEQISQNQTQDIQRIKSDTTELVGAFRSAKGAFDVLQVIGRIAKPILWTMALVGAVIAFVKLGEWPK
jgi:hypothetical protein